MTKPLKPPRGIFISSGILFDLSLKPQLKDTLIQLMALAWSSPGCRSTPLLSYSLLAELTGKSIKTLYGHIAVLRDHHAALRLQPAGDGTFSIIFSEYLFHKSAPCAYSKNSEWDDEEEDSATRLKKDNSLTGEDVHLPVNVDQTDKGKNRKRKPLARKNIAKDGRTSSMSMQESRLEGLSAELTECLREAGVFPGLFAEISASDYSEEELMALLAWTQEENPQRAAALFMGRMRMGAQAPACYSQTPCPICGAYGERHSADCGRRYISGTLKDLVQH